MRATFWIGLPFLALAACTPGPAGEAPQAAIDAPAGDEAGAGEGEAGPSTGLTLAFEETTEAYGLKTSVDPRIANFDPVLALAFLEESRDAMRATAAPAETVRAEAEAVAAETGSEPWFRPYELEDRFVMTASLDDVISIRQDGYADTGGAHPNYFLRGRTYLRGENEPLALSAIIADDAAFRQKVIARLTEEKLARGYEPVAREVIAGELQDLLGEEGSVRNYVLNTSDQPGKIGGLTVMFSPYDVGPWAEGAYEITFSARDLSGLITPDWAGRFGGRPVIETEVSP
jgi:hypothetical protein